MSANPPNKSNGIVAGIIKEQLKGVCHNSNKLGHLQNCQILFPPKILLHLWSHCGKHVVEIHYNMNECVYKTEEGTVTARSELYSPPY
jgi:hypothetical protein